VAGATEACAYFTPDAFQPGAGTLPGQAVANTIGTGAAAKNVLAFNTATGAHTDQFFITRTGSSYIAPHILWRGNSTDYTKNVCWEVCIVTSPPGTTSNFALNDGTSALCSVTPQPSGMATAANVSILKDLNGVSVIDHSTGGVCVSAAGCKSGRTMTTLKRVACASNDYAGAAELLGVWLCWTQTTPP
jgi:hypothetical protein